MSDICYETSAFLCQILAGVPIGTNLGLFHLFWALLDALEAQIKEKEKAARDSQSKADAIGASVFDLKAVNPNVVTKLDTRTPAEVIQSIEDQGKIVSECLKTLRALLETGIG